MRVGVVGINHKLADLKVREQLAKICTRKFGPDCSIHPEQTFVLLSTCNRTELYFSSGDLPETHNYILSILRQGVGDDFDQKLYSYFREDAFLHLAKVTAGLDSAIVGETEIQGQVKIAYEKACRYADLPHELHFLFQKSLRIGKTVRSKLLMGRGMPDLEHAILNVGSQLFDTPEASRILFIGASDINFKVIHFLKKKEVGQITLCNRTEATARIAANKYELELLPWERLHHWHHYDWIICGTKSPEYLLTHDTFPGTHPKRKLIIDLCVPRNVEPKLARNRQITLMNIDQINRLLRTRRKQMNTLLQDAEEIILTSALRHVDIFRNKEQVRSTVLTV
ncbi:MAG: glutamyl-tRNA reductase [Chlamydiales bacterium]|nr:glutamyl-tRNA reductase [Chlamydiia bacterium]MCP5506971.1 glutamyl-tRNA reductase [Chlamydiales bacterium]